MNESLSETMEKLSANMPDQGLTIGALLERTGHEGMLALIILLTCPFLLPVSIPGTSTPFGILIIYICVAMITGRPLRLPRRLSARVIRKKHMITLANKVTSLYHRIEKWIKPRLHPVTTTATARKSHTAAVMISAVCMMMPLPLPLTNTIPAYSIVFFVLGLLRRDGYMVIAGYVFLALILTYFYLVYTLGVAGFKQWLF